MNKKRKKVIKDLISHRIELDRQCIDLNLYKVYYSIDLNDNDMIYIEQLYKSIKKFIENT